MTRDDIIRMAREAGLKIVHFTSTPEAIERFAALVAAAEREALKEERRRDMFEICSLRESEESLREEIDALRADAERYRWHRADIAKHMSHSPEVIDAVIDAAMKEAALRQEVKRAP